jgi:hypothetical protein
MLAKNQNCLKMKIKKEIEPFAGRLQKLILKKLETKKHREIEKELKRSNQLYQNFIVGGVFHNKFMLLTYA